MGWPDGLPPEWARDASQDQGLFRSVMRWARNEERAREAIQEALSRVADATDRARESYDDFLRWLCVTARNVVVSWHRQSCRARQLMNVDVIEQEADPAGALRDRRLAALEEIKAGLPEDVAELVRLRWVEGWTFEAIAQEHGVSVATVWRRSRAAIQHLRSLFFERDPELFDGFDEGPAGGPPSKC